MFIKQLLTLKIGNKTKIIQTYSNIHLYINIQNMEKELEGNIFEAMENSKKDSYVARSYFQHNQHPPKKISLAGAIVYFPHY